jgi:hypothetical protein
VVAQCPDGDWQCDAKRYRRRHRHRSVQHLALAARHQHPTCRGYCRPRTGYGRSPVEALVAAGYLSPTELGVVEMTTLTGDLSAASIDSLLSEIRRRVLAANPEDAHVWPAGWSTDNPGVGRGENGEHSGDLNN